MTKTALAKVDTQDQTKAQLKNLARGDGWENVTSGHGTKRDRRFANRTKSVPPSTNRQEWEDLYVGDDMAAKIIDLPIEDMIREWITVNVDTQVDGEADRGGEVKENVQVADDVLQFLDDLDARANVTEAMTWARVFGGGLLRLDADDGNPNQWEPLNEDRIRSLDTLVPYDRWEVEIFRTYDDHTKLSTFGKPEIYRVISSTGERGGAVAPEELVHETRMIRFKGVRTNRRRMRRNDGWHDPALLRVQEILGDFGISWAGVAHLLSDFAQAVFKMKGLADAVSQSEGALVLERMMIMDTCRSTVRMIPIDAEDEDFERKVTPMAGLPQTMDRLMIRLAAAARMPVTVLFGRSAAGMNATGEGDQKMWHERVGAMQETDLRSPLERLIKIALLAGNGPTNGREPQGWALHFNPLDHPTEKEKADTRKITAETDQTYIDLDVLDAEEVRQSRFGGETYSSETTIDANREPPTEPEPPANPPPFPPQPEPTEDADHDDGVCDPDSPNYDPEKCAARKDARREDRVEKRGEKFVVLNEAGDKVLGEHETREAALRQLRAIEASKNA